MGDFNASQLVQAKLADPATAARVAGFLNVACIRFGIDTNARLAGFLSQCSHESGGFRIMQENLNYSAEALLRVFSKRFDASSAQSYARHPEMIANHVYASRMGNGDEASGDGWRFHGRGFIQLTGRDNYAAFSAAIGRPDVIEAPDLVATPDLAALSAAWFWKKNGLNVLADVRDVVGMTRKINGGTLGLEERKKLYASACSVFR